MLLYLDSLTKQKKLEKGALLYFNTKKRILSSSKSIIEEESDENFFKLYKMNGYVNEEIASYSTITLTNAAFHKLAKGSDISSWFYSLPKGMRVIAADRVAKGDTRMQ